MDEPFRPPGASFATLLRVAGTYCHPEADEEAYGGLVRRARREHDHEMALFKQDLRLALAHPERVPEEELRRRVRYFDRNAPRFLRRLWHDLYPGEAPPGQPPPGRSLPGQSLPGQPPPGRSLPGRGD
ncbi:hypothetical protein [Sphaerisporangium corydalis]|uniref:Uncharacterized protein n=1 Tax=Sphaerisporangium corydalis TaxID=1441875 RepID=A0ABV9EQE6_9ACTN|nr:hypothetical protein [Sphaerisporangium corydalis]